MNVNDINRLNEFDKRYDKTDMTDCRLVNRDIDSATFLNHIKTDLEVLSSSELENKYVGRLIMRDDIVDIRTMDNGSVASYLFTDEARFTPDILKSDLMDLCGQFNILFTEILNFCN